MVWMQMMQMNIVKIVGDNMMGEDRHPGNLGFGLEQRKRRLKGRAATPPPSGLPNPSTVSMPQLSIPLTYDMWRAADLEE